MITLNLIVCLGFTLGQHTATRVPHFLVQTGDNIVLLLFERVLIHANAIRVCFTLEEPS